MFLPDLESTNGVSSVGYLARGHAFPKGEVSNTVFERLVELVEHPFFISCGYHVCELGWCFSFLEQVRPQPSLLYQGRRLYLGSTEILVPGDGVVYEAPTLILHYICRHRYFPPSCFVEAVLKCPPAGSAEHKEAIGRVVPELYARCLK